MTKDKTNPDYESEKDRISALLKVADMYKDRLHTLQNTEWNVYYSIWIIILSSAVAVISASWSILPSATEGIKSALIALHVHPTENIRLIRCVIFLLFSFVYNGLIFYHYFFQFYGKNYESLVSSRNLFEFYTNTALNTCYTSHATADPKRPPYVLYTATPQRGSRCGDKVFHSILELENDTSSCINRKLKTQALPDIIDRQKYAFKKSELYIARRFIMASVMIIIILIIACVAYIAPLSVVYNFESKSPLFERIGVCGTVEPSNSLAAPRHSL